ncbi:hypothetical protein RI129_007666 [Pyrocoelia pectoralis]|uniref:Peptidase S1 domain-containing protein n=1 Tax=Pyrocoelia pectoralis TaxID=417401 RepID=A0AAN7ZMZ4_9COLE
MNSAWVTSILLISKVLSNKGCDRTNCTTLSSCPDLQKYVTNPARDNLKDVEGLICDIGEDVQVCCDQKRINNLTTVNVVYNNDTACGIQNEVYQFPWMVAFMAFGWSFCSGALLNERYVLTSASCATQDDVSKELFTLLLADFNLKNNACNHSITARVEDCWQMQSFSIEEAIPHPLYNTTLNDVGLIRLNQSVTYTEYIQPICLPTKVSKWQPGNELYTSGFIVHFDQTIQREKFKRNTSIILKSLDECREWYKKNGGAIPLNEFNFCSIDNPDIEAFDVNSFVDHGGPVVSMHNNQWYIEGVLSLAVDVRDDQRPIINTNITYYLDWIYNNMRPWD